MGTIIVISFSLIAFFIKFSGGYETTLSVEDFVTPAKTSQQLKQTVPDLLCLHVEGQKLFYPLEQLSAVKWENASQVTFLRLNLLQLEPNKFFPTIPVHFPHLEKINLENVIWEGNVSQGVVLPNLLSVHILRKDWKISDPAEFESILFAFKKGDNLLPNFIRIEGEHGGIFEKDRSCGVDLAVSPALTVTDIPFDVWHLQPQVRCLTLTNSTLDLGRIHGGRKTLEEITSRNVQFQNGHLASVIKDFTSLTYLDFGQTQNTSTMGLTPFDLSLLPPAIYIVKLEGTRVFASSELKLPELAHLLFQNSIVDLDKEVVMGKALDLRFIRLLYNNLTMDQLEFIYASPTLKWLMVHEDVGNLTFDPSLLSSSKSINGLSLDGFHISFQNGNSTLKFSSLTFLRLIRCSLSVDTLVALLKSSPRLSTIELGSDISADLLPALMNTTIRNIFFNNIFSIVDQNVKAQLYACGIPRSQNKAVIMGYIADPILKYRGKSDEDMGQIENHVFYAYITIVGIVAGFGLFGNGLSIWVLSGRRSLDSTTIILTMLAVYDILILLSFLLSMLLNAFIVVTLFFDLFKFPSQEPREDYLYQIMPQSFKSEILAAKNIRWSSYIPLLGTDPVAFINEQEEIQASILYPVGKAAYTGSVYTTILITLERYVAVCWPLRAKSFLSVKRSVLASGLVFIFACGLNSPRLFETRGSILGIVNRGNDALELTRKYLERNILEYQTYRTYFHGYTWSLFMFVIPILLITTLNVRIWLKVRQSARERRAMTSSSRNDTGDSINLTLMLLTISGLFVVCNSINGIITLCLVTFGRFDPKDAEVWSSLPLVINSSVNFIIYCLMGKRFRTEFMRKVRVCAPCFFKATSVTPTSSKVTSVTPSR